MKILIKEIAKESSPMLYAMVTEILKTGLNGTPKESATAAALVIAIGQELANRGDSQAAAFIDQIASI